VGRPVAVAVDLPRLELDRPFTYLLADDAEAPVGSVVSVPFHGRTVHGWVLGETEDVPSRVLPVRRVLSSEPVFDERALELFAWMRDRYVVPLSVAIDRAVPPRVASEEGGSPSRAPELEGLPPGVLGGYEEGGRLAAACRDGKGVFVVHPLAGDEAAVCVESVLATVAGGRDAVVVIPEVEPLPRAAAAVLEAAGPAGVLFAGGDRRARYRTWLEILRGRYRVVVGTRPAVFSLVPKPGLVWVHREAHAVHREERTPAYHPREVALARAALEGAVCVLAGLSPSAHAAAMVDDGSALMVRAPRGREREAAPLVETTKPADEDRSPRLAALLKGAPGAFLLVSRRGYGTARVCRACGEPARCAVCHGPIVVRDRREACAVCGADGRCAACGAANFGVERGGTERIEEWARRVTELPVRRVDDGAAIGPEPGEVVVGTAAAVKDPGPRSIGLVGILDADRARRRAGLEAPEQVLATWFEAASWAGPRAEGGKVLVQTREPGDPAIQALVRWDPLHFHRRERARREEAGFAPGVPLFRVLGSPGLEEALRALDPAHLLTTALGDQTVCLVAIRPDALEAFRERILDLVGERVVERVEAEPRL
jgi:primosomal protein N' (replication factor Y)